MSFTRDVTSTRPIPQSAAEFTSFLSGSGIANPFAAWMFNQISGDCIDLIGSNNLVVSGPFSGPAYGQTISGWAAKGILFHNGNDDGAVATGGTLPSVATESCLVFVWIEWPDPGVATVRSGIGIGTRGTSPQHSLSLSPGHDTIEAVTNSGSITSPAGWAGGGPPTPVYGVLLQLNRDVLNSGANVAQVVTHVLGQLTIAPPNNGATLTQGQEIRIGNGDFGSGTGVASGAKAIYACAWKGTAAELDLTQLVALKDLFYDIVPPAVAGPYWGPHFPDAAGSRFFFGPHFPDGKPDPTIIPGSGPDGVATLVLLQAGTKTAYAWGADVDKVYNGREYRAQPLDDPRQTFTGPAVLAGDQTRASYVALAKYAAIGAPFSLALPFESLSIRADATGAVVPTASTAFSDWLAKGQRVAVIGGGGAVMNAVIQDFDGSSITLDVDPGVLGKAGGTIAPRVPVYLDPQTGFTRHRGTNAVETWQINARHALFGFQSDSRIAFAALSASTGALADAVIQAAIVGAAGNAYSITFVADHSSGPPSYNLAHTGTAYTFHYDPAVTTVGDFVAATAGVFVLAGSFDPSAALVAGDAIGPIALHDGADKGYGTMGAGATVNTYDGRPVWDRGIQVNDTAGDSIQSLAETLDLGGLPIQIGSADAADWGRQVMIERTGAEERQWLKAFLAAVRGNQRAFWLPSSRPDLIAVSIDSPTAITIHGPDAGAGDITAWWPTQRDRLQIEQLDETITYARITAVVDNGDGTMAVTIDPATALSGAAIAMVSWLELCRFDAGTFEITYSNAPFKMDTKARVVQQ